MFPSKRISQLEASLSEANQTVATLTAERDSLAAQLAGVITPEAHAEVVTARDNAIAQVATLEARVTELEAAQVSAGQQAAEIVAAVAVPPVGKEAEGGSAKQTVTEIRARFDAETDPHKRAAIWSELKAALN